MFASIPCNRRNRPPYCPLTLLNGQTLRRGLRHRHAAGDFEPVRMVGHRRVLIASFKASVGNLLDRRRAITPFGVHLQITAVLVDRGASEGGIREDSPHLRAAQESADEGHAAAEYRRAARSARWPVRRSAIRRSPESRGSRASTPARCLEFAAAHRRDLRRSVSGMSNERMALAARL